MGSLKYFFILLGAFVRWVATGFRFDEKSSDLSNDSRDFWIGVATVIIVYVVIPVVYSLLK